MQEIFSTKFEFITQGDFEASQHELMNVFIEQLFCLDKVLIEPLGFVVEETKQILDMGQQEFAFLFVLKLDRSLQYPLGSPYETFKVIQWVDAARACAILHPKALLNEMIDLIEKKWDACGLGEGFSFAMPSLALLESALVPLHKTLSEFLKVWAIKMDGKSLIPLPDHFENEQLELFLV